MVRKTISPKLKKIINSYIKKLKSKKVKVQSAYIFGSYAKNKNNKFSDIDLCLVSDDFTNNLRTIELLWGNRPIDNEYRIEPIGLTSYEIQDKFNSLSKEIRTYGIKVA